jgi:hypothetical protein
VIVVDTSSLTAAYQAVRGESATLAGGAAAAPTSNYSIVGVPALTSECG